MTTLKYPQSIALIYKGETIIGYCHTFQEADDLCKKYPDLSWTGLNKNKNNLQGQIILIEISRHFE